MLYSFREFISNVMPVSDSAQYQFGPFTLDPVNRLLMQEDKPVTLPPRVIDTLLLLVENAGRVLTKEELLAAVWPDCFVEEGNLTQAVFQLRKALGESGSKQQYIETIPKRGYRFVAELRVVTAADEPRTLAVTEAPLPETNGAVAPFVPAPVRDTPAKVNFISGKKRLAAMLIVLALTIVVFGVFHFKNKLPFFRSAKPSFAELRFTKLTTSGTASLPALSPDGRYVAYVNMTHGQQSLWIQPLSSSDNVQLVPPAAAGYHGVTFARDGQFIYFVKAERGQAVAALFKIPLVGGTPRKVLEDVNSPITFAPDGKRFAFVRRVPKQREFVLLTAAADGTDERPMTTRREPQFLSLYGAAWSPDGRTIAYPAGERSAGVQHEGVMTLEVANGKETALSRQRWAWIGQVAWDKDGSGVLFDAWERGGSVYSDQLRHLSFPDGELSPVTNDLLSYNYVSVAARTGAMVTTRAERSSRLWIGNPSRTEQSVQLKSGFGENYSEEFGLNWAPDGRIVYGSQAAGNPDIWIAKPDGSAPTQLTFDPATDILPAATADGRHLVFVSNRAGQNNLWRMDLDGANPKQLTHGAGEAWFSLSADSQWVIYPTTDKEGKGALWRVSIDGGEPALWLEQEWIKPVISPDGQWIAGLLNDKANGGLKFALGPVRGGNRSGPLRFFDLRMTPLRGLLQWTPDSRALILIAQRNGVANLWQQPLDGSAPHRLTDFQSDQIFRFAWSPDGQQLACERGLHTSDLILLNHPAN